MRLSQPTVYLVDDDDAVCQSLALLIESEGMPVRCFASARAFMDAYEPGAPDCLVLDVRMPGLDGLGLQQALAEKSLLLPIVFICGEGDIATVTQAFRGGAADFFQKPIDVEAFLKRVKDCLEKGTRDWEKASHQARIRTAFTELTPRESNVMTQMLSGRSNKEIAKSLGISHRTVEIHRARVMEKMQVDTLSELVNKVWGCMAYCGNALLPGNCPPDCRQD